MLRNCRKIPPGKFSPGKFPPIKLTIGKSPPKKFVPEIFPPISLILSYYKNCLEFLHETLAILKQYACFNQHPLIHAFLTCLIQACSAKCLCGKLSVWKEFTEHLYYKHKTFDKIKLLNLPLCLAVSSITFILYS